LFYAGLTSRIKTVVGTTMLAFLTACGAAALPGEGVINDPSEDQNRAMFDFNVAVDRTIMRPVSVGAGTILPEPARRGVGNFASNLDQPRYVLNNLLQLRFEAALQNTWRFAINSTVGLGGLLDPASSLGLYEVDTNFGETLHVWGAPEGAYVVLPILGPSTSRDTVGIVVDRAMNPVRFFIPTPESYYLNAANIGSAVDTRYRFGATIDELYYESADGYAAARILYLSNRRFRLRGEAQDDYFDPYTDAYEDPNAQ
jgi:phospholipid-binding lipoprotein MlaA